MSAKHPLQAFRESQQPPLSKARLAELLDVSPAAITRWESGKRYPRRRHLTKISEQTGIAADVLFAFEKSLEAAE